MKTTGQKNAAFVNRQVVKKYERSFDRGQLMFIEGEQSSEMFIVRKGLLRILKQQGEKTYELARLGPGAVLGELSLLDKQPRAASAQVLEPVTVTIVDDGLLKSTLQNVPPWLAGVINTIVKRLRDTMKKTGDDLVYNSVSGVLKILLLLYQQNPETIDGRAAVRLSRVENEIYKIIGIGSAEIEKVFIHLALKELVFIRKNSAGAEYVTITDLDTLALYVSFLRAKVKGTKIPGADITEAARTLIDILLETAKTHGKKSSNSSAVRVTTQQVEIQSQRMGSERFIDPDALEVLVTEKAVMRQTQKSASRYGAHPVSVLVFSESTLSRLKKMSEKMALFAQPVQF